MGSEESLLQSCQCEVAVVELFVIICLAVLRKRGKLIVRLRAFFSSRPERIRLKRSGIVKERVFGCDLGEHLLNSGNDGNCCCCCQVKHVV